MTRLSLQRRYRPAEIRLLFIGEAPPASGRFFYQRDSGLYRAMRDAFQSDDENFLDAFQAAGCYLIDLCPQPVDKLPPKARSEACANSEPLLARTIARLQPQAIATVVRSIRRNVANAAAQAGWQGAIHDLPYPGRWSRHRDAFIRQLRLLV